MFSIEHLDRRRLVLATVVTLVALPSLWLTSRSESSGAPNVATAGVVIDGAAIDGTAHDGAVHDGSEHPDGVRPSLDAMGSAGGAFLATDESGPGPRSDEPVRIAVPRVDDQRTADGRATYRSGLASTDICAVRNVPYGIRVRITNLDNGHSVTCVASAATIGVTDDVVLHTRAFAQIADLTDAPVPVEITW